MVRLCILILVFMPLSLPAYEISEEELTQLESVIDSLATQLEEQERQSIKLQSELQEVKSELSQAESLYERQRLSLQRSEKELRRTRWIVVAELGLIVLLLLVNN